MSIFDRNPEVRLTYNDWANLWEAHARREAAAEAARAERAQGAARPVGRSVAMPEAEGLSPSLLETWSRGLDRIDAGP